MCLNGFEFEVFYHGFQLYLIEALALCAGYIVVHKVQQTPDGKKQGATYSCTGQFVFKRSANKVLRFPAHLVFYNHHHAAVNKAKNQGGYNHPHNLLEQAQIKQFGFFDNGTHEVRNEQAGTRFAKNGMEIKLVIAVIGVDAIVVKRVQQHIKPPAAQLCNPVIW